MPTGTIVKALSGFYYVNTDCGVIECRARGRFRLDGVSPLVGDRVEIVLDPNGKGTVDIIHERKNSFFRPSVANIDCMVILASAVNPITDPFLIDRVTALAENAGCEVIVCVNKTDMDSGDRLFEIYSTTGYTLIRTSATTGEGISELKAAIRGKLCAFTGNSGVGKSSLLNALSPELDIKVGEVSDKLGRGRHTTRHVEIFSLGDGAYIADTPGFGSFDMEKMEHIPKENLQYSFQEFAPYIGKCRFDDCAHIKEPGCAILGAVKKGVISLSRHESYAKLYELASQIKDWEVK
ncbi:MAG: ribosome small subunit-dependent GTPase A [Firmicutes bacterium HGW-Firmicutes-16]|nr:MAG: ribosome small subunit-dependent GTPase A [Firmicutes bacterium HGW-Firmicutes-16]